MDPRDAHLCHLADRHHGLLTDEQALSSGELTRSAWRHRVTRGDWERLARGVVRRPGAPPTDEQRSLAAVLSAGASSYLSLHSGAALWSVPGFCLEPFQVMSLRSRQTRTDLAQLHFPRHLPDPFAAVVSGVPVVRPALLLLQMAPLVHPARLGRMLDNMWSRRLLSGPSVRRELDPLMHRGRPGTVAMRELLDSLPEDYVPPASNLEARFAQILRDADLPPMRRQIDLGDDDRWCGRVDFVASDLPLIVEVNSDRYHAALSDQAADAARRKRLELAGFVVEEVSEFDIWHRRDRVVSRVRAARRELRRSAT